MAFERLVDEAGPNGGVRCMLAFYDDNMIAVDEDEATQSIMTELDVHGDEVARTYVTLPAKKDRQKLKGGLADDKEPSDFDPEQLQAGIEVEREHTEDHSVAQEIAMDHLTEDPDYYKKLEKAGL